MHVPVRLNSVRMYIVRALPSDQFTLLHPADCDISDIEIFMDTAEFDNISLGKCQVQVRLPAVSSDNGLRRSLILLGDETIGGILNQDAVTYCNLQWQHMSRSSSAVAK